MLFRELICSYLEQTGDSEALLTEIAESFSAAAQKTSPNYDLDPCFKKSPYALKLEMIAIELFRLRNNIRKEA